MIIIVIQIILLIIILIIILAIFYPPLKQIWGCGWLCLLAQEGNIYFTELAERVEYGNYDPGMDCPASFVARWRRSRQEASTSSVLCRRRDRTGLGASNSLGP